MNKDLLGAMCMSIAHRGPDDQGLYFDDETGIGLGHRRLSIIDLAGGRQPMSNADGDIWIVFNGEIYNFRELKSELVARGFSFRTSSDTEVIVYLYQEFGVQAFSRLNGIFAFAIYDMKARSVLIARAPFGVKPLYYYMGNGTLYFGSEIKAILKSGDVPRGLDFQALNSFLTFRYNPSPQTLFKEINKLPPGCYLRVTSTGNSELVRFWDPVPVTNSSISETEAVEQYQHLVEQAVRRQMVSDVPVGLMLSGGIDSAIIGHLMQECATDKIKTFSVGFEGVGDYNELDDARSSAELIGSDHHELTISRREYLDFFFRSFYFSEEPIAEPTIPALYYVSKLASRHVKVVMAGQGADEPLAGYKRYFGENILSKYSSILGKLPLNSVARMLPRNERFKRAAYASQFTDEALRFLAIYTIFSPGQIMKLLNQDTRKKVVDVNASLVEALYQKTSGISDSLSKILFIDTRMSLSDNLLIFGDKMSMANSLEMRVPFLDIELVNFVESLPGNMKLRGSKHKFIHKKAAEKWLPSGVINRKKRGFVTPMDQWLQADLAEEAKRIINDRNSASRNYFNLPYINKMIELHRQRKENYQKQIFALLSFEVWHKSFFDSERFNPAR